MIEITKVVYKTHDGEVHESIPDAMVYLEKKLDLALGEIVHDVLAHDLSHQREIRAKEYLRKYLYLIMNASACISDMKLEFEPEPQVVAD